MNGTATRRERLPFGIQDLVSEPTLKQDNPRTVRCYVRGCSHLLRTPTRGYRGEACPEHGVRCHFSSGNGTYSYIDASRNIIASPRMFKERVIGHPFKYESHRLGLEKSEDSLSWNVCRSLEEADLLHLVAAMVTGEKTDIQPFLFLWGICTTDDEFEPWDLLVRARTRFESNLPVQRPLTEPDIALWLPGRYLILIEAKFTSMNTSYERGPRANSSSLTLGELTSIYQSRELQTLDYAAAARAQRIYYQLWRNMVFAEWMARADHPNTEAYHVNLVREGCDEDSAAEFTRFVRPEFRHRFQQMTWEQIYARIHDRPEASTLIRYLETKTAGLKPAFTLQRSTIGGQAC